MTYTCIPRDRDHAWAIHLDCVGFLSSYHTHTHTKMLRHIAYFFDLNNFLNFRPNCPFIFLTLVLPEMRILKTFLWTGPPGTGKTSLCKALAHKLCIRLADRFPCGQLVEINSHSLFSKWFSEVQNGMLIHLYALIYFHSSVMSSNGLEWKSPFV